MDLTQLTLTEHMQLKKEQKELNKLYKGKHKLDMDCISMLNFLLNEKPETTVKELHEELGLCKTSIYIKLTILANKKLIKKEHAKTNRNMYIISLNNETKVKKMIKTTEQIVESRGMFMF